MLLLHSCVTTHTNTVINEPDFAHKGEVQIAATAAPDNIEGQAGYAFSNNFGVIANAYRGFSTPFGHKNTNIYEAGINYFNPSEKEGVGHFSYTLGFLLGRNNKKGSNVALRNSMNHNSYTYEVHAKYRGAFAQVSYIKKGLFQKHTTMFSLKSEYINVTDYQFRIREVEAGETPEVVYNYLLQANNRNAYQFRGAITHHVPIDDSNLFCRLQFGYTYTTGFRIKEVEGVDGTTNIYKKSYYGDLKQMRPRNLFFNILLGLKL